MEMNLLFLALFVSATPDDASLLVDPTLGAHPQTARSIGMGGAQRGIADNTDALYLNPAGMGMNKRYVIEGNYSWSQQPNAHRPSAAIIDSATTVVAAGVGYNFERRVNSGEMDVHRVNFGLSYTVGGIFGIGATFKYLNAVRTQYGRIFDETTRAPRTSISPYPAEKVTAFTGDLALMLTPIQYFSVAVIGYNLLPNPTWAELTPLALGVAAALHIAGLEVDVDAVFDFTTLRRADARLHFGAEYTIAQIIPIRAGFIYDRIGQDLFWSAGAGFRHPSFGIDFGYRQAIARPDNRTLSIGLLYYMK
jgi:opacity protein-like surface antigen